MKFAVFTVSCPLFTPEETIRVLSECGYDGVEWRVAHQGPVQGTPGFYNNHATLSPDTLADEAPEIRALVENAGLEMPNLGAYAHAAQPEEVEKVMRGAAALGAPNVRINVPPWNGTTSYIAARDEALAHYRDVEAMAKQFGVRALIEIHMNSLLPSASSAAAFASHFESKHVGAIHDAGNMVYEGYENYRMGLELLGPYLGHVHVKNARWNLVKHDDNGLAHWKAEWATLRDGIVDFRALMDALRAVNYDGWLSFEDFSRTDADATHLADNLKFVKSFL